ncbi:uncharacterized protein LOC125041327 [Penaeus chinensis]|uniref:uncharacterized protein LOC125041327 n=1 Tax=Penaeus chinensis TaxID=139456 RepID=UPI001FB673A1|nr:uncharacterized protein LOC125041327 [Penaeus chinensis]
MSDLRSFSRAFVEDFIDLYRDHECLWKMKSRSYSDRNMKRQAYEKLAGKLREVDPSADREAVVKKINNLRSAYRKELKKVVDSKRSGGDSAYSPKLWYFHLLSFLLDQENPRVATSNLETYGDQETKESMELDTSQDREPQEETGEEPTPYPAAEPLRQTNTSGQTRLQKRLSEEHTNPVLNSTTERLHLKTEDDFDITGKHVASKLRIVSQDQRIYAERLIAEVLFEAQLGNLSRECKLIIKKS